MSKRKKSDERPQTEDGRGRWKACCGQNAEAVADLSSVVECHRTGGGEEVPEGIALPPHERDCGRSHPMRGTNSEDLTEWCIKHET